MGVAANNAMTAHKAKQMLEAKDALDKFFQFAGNMNAYTDDEYRYIYQCLRADYEAIQKSLNDHVAFVFDEKARVQKILEENKKL